jgi:antibiotic biosynthesis monooxygenase (ABM) superfamily enzyme
MLLAAASAGRLPAALSPLVLRKRAPAAVASAAARSSMWVAAPPPRASASRRALGSGGDSGGAAVGARVTAMHEAHEAGTDRFPEIVLLDKLVKEENRDAFNVWQAGVQKVLDSELGVGNAHQHWFPPEGDRRHDIVVFWFKNQRVFQQWLSSPARKELLESGSQLQSLMGSPVHFPLTDDGSLGGWLAPRDKHAAQPGSTTEAGGSSSSASKEQQPKPNPPAKWKIPLVVLCSMYPTSQLMPVVMPSLIHLSPTIEHLPPPLRDFVVSLGMCVFMNYVSLPIALRLTGSWFLTRKLGLRTGALAAAGLTTIYGVEVYLCGLGRTGDAAWPAQALAAALA